MRARELLRDARVAYRIGGSLAVAARVALLQRVFTDNFFGDAGALVSVGAALSW